MSLKYIQWTLQSLFYFTGYRESLENENEYHLIVLFHWIERIESIHNKFERLNTIFLNPCFFPFFFHYMFPLFLSIPIVITSSWKIGIPRRRQTSVGPIGRSRSQKRCESLLWWVLGKLRLRRLIYPLCQKLEILTLTLRMLQSWIVRSKIELRRRGRGGGGARRGGRSGGSCWDFVIVFRVRASVSW